MERAKDEEFGWTQHAIQLLAKETLEKNEFLSWAAFHASMLSNLINLPALTTLLPIFPEKSCNTLVKHGMNVLKEITDYLHLGQIPVMAVDQQLFALAKYAQWSWPQTLGEDKFVVML